MRNHDVDVGGAEAERSAAVNWLRIAYWTGAIVDALAAVQMLVPSLFAFGMRKPGFAPGPDFRYAMGMGASLMLGWTALLLWADRRPLERRGVLPLTVFPVVAGLAANEAAGVADGFVAAGAVVPIWILQAALTALFLGSWARARKVARGP